MALRTGERVFRNDSTYFNDIDVNGQIIDKDYTNSSNNEREFYSQTANETTTNTTVDEDFILTGIIISVSRMSNGSADVVTYNLKINGQTVRTIQIPNADTGKLDTIQENINIPNWLIRKDDVLTSESSYPGAGTTAYSSTSFIGHF